VLRSRVSRTWVSFLKELAIVVPAYFVYFMVRGLVEGRAPEAIGRAASLIKLEESIGIFWEPTLQELLVSERLVLNLMNWVYVWGHWPVIVGVALWLFFLHKAHYQLYRNAFLISGAIGLVIFATLPVAPPRLMDSGGFVDTVSLYSRAYRVLQPPAFVNQYAAMPSLHFGWNLLLGIAIFRHTRNPAVKILGAVSPAIVLLSIVLTANHYILDAVAGGIVALLGLALALALTRRSLRPQLSPSAGS
jgi:membrane-associated phospholipid phosphatase